jgi:hypothetical protein
LGARRSDGQTLAGQTLADQPLPDCTQDDQNQRGPVPNVPIPFCPILTCQSLVCLASFVPADLVGHGTGQDGFDHHAPRGHAQGRNDQEICQEHQCGTERGQRGGGQSEAATNWGGMSIRFPAQRLRYATLMVATVWEHRSPEGTHDALRRRV